MKPHISDKAYGLASTVPCALIRAHQSFKREKKEYRLGLYCVGLLRSIERNSEYIQSGYDEFIIYCTPQSVYTKINRFNASDRPLCTMEIETIFQKRFLFIPYENSTFPHTGFELRIDGVRIKNPVPGSPALAELFNDFVIKENDGFYTYRERLESLVTLPAVVDTFIRDMNGKL
jgi:hypothetical protein